MKVSLLILTTFLFTSAFGEINGSSPLPDRALNIYPYNTVGVVANDSGWQGSGTAIGKKTVITAAHVFYDDELKKWNNQPYTWSWKRSPQNANEEGVSARSWVYFEDYASIADASDRGTADLEAFNKDIYILQFLEEIISSTPAKWKQDIIQNNPYKMIVGYPSGYYDFWERERNQLHATRGGEPTYTIFESSFESATNQTDETATTKRLFSTFNLRSTSGNSGGPLFSFDANTWTLSGVFVAGNPTLGSSSVVAIDEEVADLIRQTIDPEADTTPISYPVYNSSDHDLNANFSIPTPTGEDVTQLATIFPVNDVDYHKFQAGGSTDRLLYINAGNISITSWLEDASGTKWSGTEMVTPAGQASIYRISMISGDQRLAVKATSATSTGYYACGIMDFTSHTETHIDRHQDTETIYEMGLNDQVQASLSITQPNEYFKMTVPSDGHLIIQSDGPLNTGGIFGKVKPSAELPYDLNDLSVLSDFDVDSSNEMDFQVEVDVAEGDYILMIQSQFDIQRGFYTLKSKFIPEKLGSVEADTDYNDRFKWADYSRMLSYEESIEPIGDVDIRQFRMSTHGMINIDLTTTLNLNIQIFDSQFDLVDISTTGSIQQNALGYIVNVKLPEGRYYVKISEPTATTTGDYKIAFSKSYIDGFWVEFQGSATGEKTVDWFGTFNSSSDSIGWIEHNEHGVIFIKGGSTLDFWIWDPQLAIWFRTSQEKYPILHHESLDKDYKYVLGTKNPRKFEDMSTGLIVEEDDLPK